MRAYGQQDPLVAFQRDAFEMYGQLRAAFQEEVVRKIYHPSIMVKEAPRPRNIQAIHPDAGAAGQAQAGTPGATQQAPTPVRAQKVPGRNDACWCGSGKKYKHCHMKLDGASGNGGSPQPVPSQNDQAQAGSNEKKKGAKVSRR